MFSRISNVARLVPVKEVSEVHKNWDLIVYHPPWVTNCTSTQELLLKCWQLH